MYNYNGDNMNLFKHKQKINSEVMMHLIYETVKNNATDIFELLDKTGIIYDETEVQINIIAINYELCRYALYEGSKKEDVDKVMENLYSYFFYNMQISADKQLEYKNIMKQVSDKLKSIFSIKKLLASKEELVYRLFLEQIHINEQIIDKMYLHEYTNYARFWVNSATSINNAYMIEDTELDKKKNEHIDFRF